MEKIFEQGLLYDFYGDLLTEHQQKIYEDAVYNDLSLGEIAEDAGISRQGVHDLIKRCDKTLSEYEQKLHLIERFSKARQTMTDITALADRALQDESMQGGTKEMLLEIRQLCDRLKDEL